MTRPRARSRPRRPTLQPTFQTQPPDAPFWDNAKRFDVFPDVRTRTSCADGSLPKRHTGRKQKPCKSRAVVVGTVTWSQLLTAVLTIFTRAFADTQPGGAADGE